MVSAYSRWALIKFSTFSQSSKFILQRNDNYEQDGSVHCRIVKRMTDTCKGTRAPSKFSRSGGYGPLFYSTGEFSSTYYYFDGSIGYHWPTHDPCGSNGPNHLCNVKDPHGNIYVRK